MTDTNQKKLGSTLPLRWDSNHPMNSSDQLIRRISMAGLLVPVGGVLLCVSYAVRARWELGHWATYNHPDPKNLGWPIHHFLVLVSLLAIYPALIISALSALWLMMHRRMMRSGGLILASAVLLGFGITWLGQTPMGDEFAAWFFD